LFSDFFRLNKNGQQNHGVWVQQDNQDEGTPPTNSNVSHSSREIQFTDFNTFKIWSQAYCVHLQRKFRDEVSFNRNLRLVIEQHGQDVMMFSETVLPTGALQPLDEDRWTRWGQMFDNRFNYEIIDEFYLAVTFELRFNARAPRKEGLETEVDLRDKNLILFATPGTTTNMGLDSFSRATSTVTKYPLAFLQEICNYQSNTPFRDIDNSCSVANQTIFASNQIVTALKSQVYSGLRNFLFPRGGIHASGDRSRGAAPFSRAAITRVLSSLHSENDNRYEKTLNLQEFKDVRNTLRGCQSNSIPLRFENVIQYDVRRAREIERRFSMEQILNAQAESLKRFSKQVRKVSPGSFENAETAARRAANSRFSRNLEIFSRMYREIYEPTQNNQDTEECDEYEEEEDNISYQEDGSHEIDSSSFEVNELLTEDDDNVPQEQEVRLVHFAGLPIFTVSFFLKWIFFTYHKIASIHDVSNGRHNRINASILGYL
jgi:hypothetical protein